MYSASFKSFEEVCCFLGLPVHAYFALPNLHAPLIKICHSPYKLSINTMGKITFQSDIEQYGSLYWGLLLKISLSPLKSNPLKQVYPASHFSCSTTSIQNQAQCFHVWRLNLSWTPCLKIGIHCRPPFSGSSSWHQYQWRLQLLSYPLFSCV